MGIKFKAKLSTDKPSDGAIDERELHINLVDKDIYTSSNGTDVINLTMNPHGYVADTNKSVFTPDMKKDDFFDYTTIQSTTIGPPLNHQDGDTGTIAVRQDVNGGNNVTFSSDYIFVNGEPEILTDAYSMMVFDYKVMGTKVFMEYVASYNALQMSSYDTKITWDTMSGDTAVESDVDLEYSTDGGATFNTLLTGSVQVLGVGSGGSYELRGDGATFLKFSEADDFNGSMTVVSRGLTTGANMFKGMSNLQSIDLVNLDTSLMTSMAAMMSGWSSMLVAPDLTNFDTSKVINMYQVMMNWSAMVTPPDLTNFNTSNVTNFGSMMLNWKSITTPPILTFFDTSKATSFSSMMNGWNSLTISPDLTNFNTSIVTNMNSLMANWWKMPVMPDISNFDTSQVRNFAGFMKDWWELVELPDLTTLDTSLATDMSYMMTGWYKLTHTPDLTNFRTPNVSNMSSMMFGWHEMTVAPDLTNFNTSNVVDMSSMMEGWFKVVDTENIGIENFNIRNLEIYVNNTTSGYNMCHMMKLTPSTYDLILENFGAQAGDMQAGVLLGFLDNTYTLGGLGEAGRLLLTNAGVIVEDIGGV